LAKVDTDAGTSLTDDKRAPGTEHVQFDLTATGMARRTDAADCQRPDQTAVHFQRDACQVFDLVIGVELMEGEVNREYTTNLGTREKP
jgi:hypothetical protein